MIFDVYFSVCVMYLWMSCFVPSNRVLYESIINMPATELFISVLDPFNILLDIEILPLFLKAP